MKTLEIKNRKRTTATARQTVIDFIDSIKFSGCEDLGYIESSEFSLYDTSDETDTGYFALDNGDFKAFYYNSNLNDNDLYNRCCPVCNLFGESVVRIDFKSVVNAMENLVNKVNKKIEDKEAQIQEFYDFCEGWKAYQETQRELDDYSKHNVG